MLDDILNLIILQSLDDKIRLWRRAAEDAPDRLAAAREKLTLLETKLDEVKTGITEKRRRIRELETETADLTERRKTNQVRLLKARNNDEYRAILKEGETIVSMISARDDESLTLMDAAERLESDLGPLQAEVKAERAEFQKKSADIEAILADGLKNESLAQAEREEMLPKIPQELLSRYATVAKNRGGQAMAPVKTGQCQACRLSVPPQLFNELQRCDKLMLCPNCARIMYWTAHPHFRDFLGEEAEEPKTEPEKPEKPEKGRRKTKAKADKTAEIDEAPAQAAISVLDDEDLEDEGLEAASLAAAETPEAGEADDKLLGSDEAAFQG